MSNTNLYPITGREFKAIREGSGYSAHEVAGFFSVYAVRQKWTMRLGRTEQTVYRIETSTWVADKYVEALRALVGEDAFIARLQHYRAKVQEMNQRKREREELKKEGG